MYVLCHDFISSNIFHKEILFIKTHLNFTFKPCIKAFQIGYLGSTKILFL